MIKKSRRLSWQEWIILLTLCWLAFALRIHKLDARSLWVDEGVSLHRAEQSLPTLLRGDILLQESKITDPMPPLYFVGLAGVRAIGGESVFALRLASVWGGLFCVPLLFLLGRRLFGRPAGLIAALLGALSPYSVWYAQVARPESLFFTTTLLSVLALQRLLKGRRCTSGRYTFGSVIFWLLATGATLYTHPTGIWILAFELLVVGSYVLTQRQRHTLLAWAIVLVLLAVPPASRQSESPSFLGGYRPAWYTVRQLITEQEADPALTTDGEQERTETLVDLIAPIVRLLPAVLLTLASLTWLLWHPQRARSWLFAAGLLLVPPVVAYLIDRLTPYPLSSRYALATIPAALLLQGAGAAALWRHRRSLAAAGMLGITIVMGYWLLMQFSAPSFDKDDLKAAAAYVSEYAQEGDIVLLHNSMVQFGWDYYYDGVAPLEIIPHQENHCQQTTIDYFQTVAQAYSQVWFLYESDNCPLLQLANTQWVTLEKKDFSSPWLDFTLERYMVEPPVISALPVDVTPVELCWPEGLCLHGWSAENLVLGQEASITLYWSQNRSTDDDYRLELALQDAHGQHWSESTGPIFSFYPAAYWPTGVILAQEFRIPLSAALPPTSFSLALMVQRVSDGQLMATNTGQGINLVGTILPERPAELIDPDVLTLQYKSDADFGEKIRLLGYNLPIDTPRPGHTGFIDFYWQTLSGTNENWQQRTRLIRDEHIWVEKVGPLSVAEFYMPQWHPGDLVWGRIFLPLPGQMPPGEYKVEVTLLDPAGEPVPAKEIWRAEETESIVAGPTYLENWPMVTEPPEMPHRPDLIFGGAIRLWGYEIQGEMQPGGRVDVTLVWRDELPVEDDYHVFVHLMDEDETILGQADGAPAGWTRPTSTWRPGEFIVDQYTIPLGPDTPIGVGYLWVGLYHPGGDGRLSILNPAEGQPPDRTLLDIIVIEP